ncbi:MAG: DUF11 domain-containing protein [Desulfuromonadaceae bacterium]|nr:DUF11 domain-containing protein [Desulfuromonadaceae bacterium]
MTSFGHDKQHGIKKIAARCSQRLFTLLLFSAALLLIAATHVHAWPADSDWIPIYRGTEMLSDDNDANPSSLDIVGDATNSAAYLFNDGNYMHFRIRLDADPMANATSLKQFGWGFLLDLNQNFDDYEFMIMLDGISDTMYLAQNTVQGTLGDPSDRPEIIRWQETLTYGNNFRVEVATTTFGNNADYFLDYAIPFSVFKSSMGLTDSSIISYFVGGSTSAQTLATDLAAGSDLYDSGSNFVLPSGTQPTTGSVHFVTDSSGTTDLTEFYAGATVYLQVIDADLNSAVTSIQTVTVSVTAPSGDSQSVTLTETGLDTGIFTGPLTTSDGSPTADDGILQTTPIEIVTVTYIDGADATTPVPLQNQPRTDTAQVLPAADIAVTKSVDHETPNEGETITYTIRATNNGPSNASGIQISDLLPSGVTYVSHSAPTGTSYNFDTGLWSAGSLTKDAFKELTITATVNSGTAQTTIRNIATRSAASQPDPNNANDSDFADISVTGADLSITKTVDNITPAVGSTVHFVITVTNNGTYPATNVVVTDILPTATWASLSNISVTQGTTSYGDGTFVWNVGTVAYPGPGNVATLEFDAKLAAASSGTTVTNTAAITAVDQKDPHPGDDVASVTLVVGGIDLSVTKVVTSPSPATPNVGDSVVFTITVSNNLTSSTEATGVEVSDLLSTGLTYVSATPSEGTYNSGIWSGLSLAPGESQTLDLTATVDSGTAGLTLTNTATISAYNEVDINTGNHSAAAAVAVKAADLSIVKTVDNPTPSDNTNVTFTIIVTNVGTTAASDISIYDLLPGQVTFVSSSADQGSYDDQVTHLWSGISLPVAGTATLTITAKVNLSQQDPKTFFNTAALNASTPEDSNATNDVSSTVVSVSGTDLGITKTMNTGYTNYPASPSTTQFLLTLTNYGPNPATNIKVKDTVPDGFSCASGTPSVGTFVTNKCEWTVSALAVDAVATLVLTSAITAPVGSTRTNQATITVADQADPNGGNNSATQLLYVGASDISVAKNVDNPTPNVGDSVTFTVTLTNNGSNNVTGLSLTDLLPTGLSYSSHSVSAGQYNAVTGLWDGIDLTYSVGPPEVKETATLTLTATVDSGTAGTVITNEAVFSPVGFLDPNTANDRASASIAVQQADIYIDKIADTLTPYSGETVTFTITAGNYGPDTATNLIVRDLLPTQPDSSATPSPVFSGVVSTPSQGTYNSTTGDWVIGTLAKNATATLTLTATVVPGSEGMNITNTASKVSADQTDVNTTNDSKTVAISPRLLTIDLRLTKSVNNATPDEGANVNFTLTLYNLHASVTATGIEVSDLLNPLVAGNNGFSFISATPAANYNTTTGIWSIPSLGPMSNTSLVLTAATLNGTGGTTITNLASITAHDQNDNDTTNNTASVDVAPVHVPKPSLTVLKAVYAESDPVNGTTNPFSIPGAIMRYEIQIFNSGNGSPDAASLIINDPIPANTALVVTDPPVTFVDGTPTSNLTVTYNSLGDATDHIDFCNGTDCTYTPTVDASGTDPAVKSIRITPAGTMNADSGSGSPNFKVMFKVLIQ